MKKNTFRFCVTCDKIKLFKYNKKIGHSECVKCKSRFAIKNINDIQIEVEKRFVKKILRATEEYKQNGYNKKYFGLFKHNFMKAVDWKQNIELNYI